MGKWIFILIVLLICGFFIYGSRNNQLTFDEIRPLAKILLARRSGYVREKIEPLEKKCLEAEKELKVVRQTKLADARKKVAELRPRIEAMEKQLTEVRSSTPAAEIPVDDGEEEIRRLERKKDQCAEKIDDLLADNRDLDDNYNKTETVTRNRYNKKGETTESRSYQRRQTSMSWLDYQSRKNKNNAKIRELEEQQEQIDQRLEQLRQAQKQHRLDQRRRNREQDGIEGKLADARREMDSALDTQKDVEREIRRMEAEVNELRTEITEMKKQLTLEETPEFQANLGLVEAHIWCHALDSRRYARKLLKVAAEPGIENYDQLVAELSVNYYNVKSRMSSGDFNRRRRELAKWLGLDILDSEAGKLLFYDDPQKVELAAESVRKNYRREKSLYRKIMDALF